MHVRDSDLPSRKLGGEVVVHDLESSPYLTISGSGVLSIESLGEEHDRDELIDVALSHADLLSR